MFDLNEEVERYGAAIYVAGVLALTDPGPAAAGVVIEDQRGHLLSHRSYYLGHSTAREAGLRAFVAALRLKVQLELTEATLVVDDPWLAGLLKGEAPLPEQFRDYTPWVESPPVAGVEVVSAAANPARTVALAPLVQWLPERTRRAEALEVKKVGEGEYEVASEHSPDVVYRVHLPAVERSSDGEGIRCECPDYQYRRIPCKHLLVVAQSSGGRERLFYPEAAGGEGIPGGPREVSPQVNDRE